MGSQAIIKKTTQKNNKTKKLWLHVKNNARTHGVGLSKLLMCFWLMKDNIVKKICPVLKWANLQILPKNSSVKG